MYVKQINQAKNNNETKTDDKNMYFVCGIHGD